MRRIVGMMRALNISIDEQNMDILCNKSYLDYPHLPKNKNGMINGLERYQWEQERQV